MMKQEKHTTSPDECVAERERAIGRPLRSFGAAVSRPALRAVASSRANVAMPAGGRHGVGPASWPRPD